MIGDEMNIVTWTRPRILLFVSNNTVTYNGLVSLHYSIFPFMLSINVLNMYKNGVRSTRQDSISRSNMIMQWFSKKPAAQAEKLS